MEKTDLFNSMINWIFLQIETVNTRFDQFFGKIAILLYPYSMQLIEKLPLNEKTVKLLTISLGFNLRIICKFTMPDLNQHLKKYDPLIPLLRTVALQFKTNTQNKQTFLTINHSIFFFISSLFKFVQSCKKKISSIDPLAFKSKIILNNWLNSICEVKDNDISSQQTNSLIISFNTIFCCNFKKSSQIFLINDQNKVVQKIENIILNEQKEEKKLILQSYLLYFTTPLEVRKKDIDPLVQLMNFNEENFKNKNPIKIIQGFRIFLTILFHWNGSLEKDGFLNSISEDHQVVFESFLIKIEKIFKQYAIESSTEIKSFLQQLVIASFEYQWLKLKRPTCLNFFNWVISLLNFENLQAPCLQLILFKQKFCLVRETVILDFENIMRQLSNYVTSANLYNSNAIYISWYLIQFISELPYDLECKINLFNHWLKKLDRHIIPEKRQKK
ncbi:MAG: hypothetical protein Q8K60_04200, partial [Parachlamydiaceae bacterium]|nr:hypothetical protein [Parachlamydiaceae bacterium]